VYFEGENKNILLYLHSSGLDKVSRDIIPILDLANSCVLFSEIGKMVSFQPNMQVHDDLAALFSRNLTFADLSAQAQQAVLVPKVEEEQPKVVLSSHANPAPAPTSDAPASSLNLPSSVVYSISQHYHHTPSQSHELQRPSSEPRQSEQLTSEAILSQHGVNPATLSQSQLQLFRIADDPQKLRLIELWSICPPTNHEENPSLAWTSTTLEQEEFLARLRYVRQAQVDQQQQNNAMSLDGTAVQSGDGRWIAGPSEQYPEPYMASGYEELMRRDQERQQAEVRQMDAYSHFGIAIGGSCYSAATDPVYKSTGTDWARQQQLQMQMENQYGSFEQVRGQAGVMDSMEIM
jgi:hypothetical protein